MKILLVEGDEVSIAALTHILTAHYSVVDVVQDGEMGWTYGSTFEYDLMVLDVVLPKLDGISLCRRFRDRGYATPILLLMAQDAGTVQVQGLNAGADDCVVKPFDPIELMARIRAILRRSSTNPLPLLTWGDLFLDPSTCEVSYNSQPVSLTTKEYELLELFLRDSQSVFGSDELIDRLWSSAEFPSEATVRSHIRRLRQKLAIVGAPPDLIATLHGRGYYLKAIDTRASTSSVPELATSDDRPDARLDLGLQQHLTFLSPTRTTTQPKSSLSSQLSSQLLVISSDLKLNHALEAAATRYGIQLEIAPDLQSLVQRGSLSKVVLVRLAESGAGLGQVGRSQLEALQKIVQQHPVSVLVISDRDDLEARLQALHRGVQVFLTAQTPIDQVMAAVVQTIQGHSLPAKVMIVDDDRPWLSTLPTLLKPWNFKVTTLAEPQQFWNVLQAVVPDALILKVEMPQINGFELCQVLRSDPQWQRSPVLLLGESNDAASQHQAFAVGADDYLCKPVVGVTLAHRLLNRLYRTQIHTYR